MSSPATGHPFGETGAIDAPSTTRSSSSGAASASRMAVTMSLRLGPAGSQVLGRRRHRDDERRHRRPPPLVPDLGSFLLACLFMTAVSVHALRRPASA